MQIAQFYFILKYLAFNNNGVYRSKFINKMSRTKKIKIDWLIDKQSRFCHLWNCIHFVHYFPVFFYTYKTRGGNIQNYYLFLSRIYLFFFLQQLPSNAGNFIAPCTSPLNLPDENNTTPVHNRNTPRSYQILFRTRSVICAYTRICLPWNYTFSPSLLFTNFLLQ